MAQSTKQSTTFTSVFEVTEGTLASDAGSDAVLLVDFDFDPGIESVEREVMTGGLSMLTPVPGMENPTVSATLEFKAGSASSADPENSKYYEAAFGAKTIPTGGTVDGNAALLAIKASPTPTTTAFAVTTAAHFFKAGDRVLVDISATSTPNYVKATISTSTFDTDHDDIVLTAALGAAPTATHCIQLVSRVKVDGMTGHAVGDALKINTSHTATANNEIVWITEIVSGTEVKIAPDLTGEPKDGNTVSCGYNFKLASTGHKTLSNRIYTDGGQKFEFAGCRPTLKISGIETGKIPQVELEFEAMDFTASDAAIGFTATPDVTTVPFTCLGVDFQVNGVDYYVNKLDFDLGLEISKKNAMNPSSGVLGSRYTKRQPKLSIDPYMEDVSEFAAWQNFTAAQIRAVFEASNGRQAALFFPNARRNSVKPADKDGLMNTEIELICGRSNVANDEAVLSFF